MERSTATPQTPEAQDSVRDIDPNIRQRMASDPEASVWVNASAGTGKTKVLTDRVLRLMLRRADGGPGTKPHKILCLTFTKAGAGEMALRINKTLGQWAVMEEGALTSTLASLLARDTSAQDITAARRLFADVVDTPGGLKIMTIHAFCQSVLSRFPLEAGLPPYFSVLEEFGAAQLLEQAKTKAFTLAQQEPSNPLNHALSTVAQAINEQQFSSLIRNIVAERHQFKILKKRHFGIDGLYTKLCSLSNIQPGQSESEILSAACDDSGFDVAGLKNAARAMIEQSGKTDQTNGQKIVDWLSTLTEQRIKSFTHYRSAFIKQNGELRTKLAGTKVSDDLKEILHTEALRILKITEHVNTSICASMTRDLLLLGDTILDHYEQIKRQKAALDFDDLIFKTEDLLKQKDGAAWVMYKLDQGLDHILIDEAQDTNPEQWGIIAALCDEFFSGQGQGDHIRSAFTVGDQKQSIYSFQRASPEEFNRMRAHFEQRVQAAKQQWAPVDLNISFRSAPSVLKAVDAVFSPPHMHKGLSAQSPEHVSFRRKSAGLVELWPVFESDEQEAFDPWDPPVNIIERASGASKLADHIAKTVAGWIKDKRILPSKGRPITAGDIMILVRTRNAFVNQLMRALKTHNVPVSGVDRMVLNEQLVVEDLMALINVALLPDDDLTLACALKSPLIGLNEDQLYALAVSRKASLWGALKESEHIEITEYLGTLILHAQHDSPYAILSALLNTPCPADKVSGVRAIKSRLGDDVLDAVEELLNAALNFEAQETPSLQGFVKWHQATATDIKRELGQHVRQLRIMTVHGAKGLQAPIVIMPDTVRTVRYAPAQIDRRFLWPNMAKIEVPLWSPRKAFDTALFHDAMGHINDQQEDEYRRLLYVAMTRAEDELYIAGHIGARKPLDESWHRYVQNGLSLLPDIEALEGGVLRLTNPQMEEIRLTDNNQKQTNQYDDLPDWALAPAPAEPDPPMPLTPSRPSESQAPVSSPLKGQSQQRFRRGNLTHKLLEILPELPEKEQENAARTFLDKYAKDLPKETRTGIIQETLAILDHPKFAPIFGPHSMAEVPISGLLADNRLISGQIDRILVTDTDIWVIDYKTNRPPPHDPADIPLIYRNQLKAYADTLRAIYPGRDIHTALLWTDGPTLMPVDSA